MIVRPGPGLQFPQLHPVGWPPPPIDPGLCVAIVPVYLPREVAVISQTDVLLRLLVDREEVTITETIHGYVGALAVGDLTAVHPARPGPFGTYLQSRRLISYDFNKHTHREWRLLGAEENALYGMWLDDEMRRIAVQIEDTSEYDDGGKVIARVAVFDVRAAPRRLGGRVLDQVEERGFGWAAGAELLAVATDGGLDVFDADVNPIPGHPLADAVQKILADVGAKRLHALRIHPSRPLAALAVCTSDNAGLRGYATYRIDWSRGAADVRPIADYAAIDGLAFGAFAPHGEAIDVRAATSGATRLVIHDPAANLVHDLGIARDLQGACWSTDPARYLAFDRAGPEILIWPGGRP